MKRRDFLKAAAALAVAPLVPAQAVQKTVVLAGARATALAAISQELLRASTFSIEEMVTRDLCRAVASSMDASMVHGFET